MNDHVNDVDYPQGESEMQAVERFKQAVNEGNIAAVAECLNSFPFLAASINEPLFVFDMPAIVLAATRGNRMLVDLLLDYGADPNKKSDWWAGGFGVLHHNHHELARYLIARGAKVDIHAAASLGMADTLASMVEEDPDVVNRRGPDGQVPLHFANSRETIDFLLERGAHIDVRDIDHGSTPAQYAVDKPWKCAYLLERGAEPDIFMACMLGDIDLARRLIAADPACVRSQVGKGQFTSGDSDGGHIYEYKIGFAARPLFASERTNHQELSDLLLEYGAAAERLLVACWRADRETVRGLLANNPEIVQSLGAEQMCLIVAAAAENRIETVRVMLETGFDPDARRCEPSMTALHHAALKGNAGLVRLLLEHSASPTLRNEFGGTALGSCIWGSLHMNDPRGDYAAVAELLILAGAPVPGEAEGSEAVAGTLRRHGAV